MFIVIQTGQKIPTGRDIYIEVDGKKIAVVQSCVTKTTRSVKSVEAFGSDVPVATVGGAQTHQLELKKVVLLAERFSQEDFYTLSDFTVMIVKPDRRIVYAGCEWNSIGEVISLATPCLESVHLTAKKRMVM